MKHRLCRINYYFAAWMASACILAALGVRTVNAQAPAPQAAVTPAQPTPNWQTYSYPADGFSASYPATPQEAKQNRPEGAGTTELRDYEVDLGPAEFGVVVNDFGAAIGGHDPQSVLEDTMNGFVPNVKAHILSTQKITLGVYPGRTFEAENDTQHFSARIYLVGTMLYQTITVIPLGPTDPDAARFLDSFQLIARTAQ
jgi:hypothetical protein